MKRNILMHFYCLHGCIFFSLLLVGLCGHGQVIMEAMPNAKPGDPAIIIYGGSNIDNRIPYSRVSGSPFWNDEWQLAALYSDNNKEKWVMKAKLNLATGEVYFLAKDSEELVVPVNMVKRIVFQESIHNPKPIAEFRSGMVAITPKTQTKNNFVQVLNKGDYQLLKLNNRHVVTADSFHIAKRYYFDDAISYFLLAGNKMETIKKLSRENILALLPDAASFSAWIDQHKINFKREAELVKFLEYYNSSKTTSTAL